jgi:hypothetical protein
MPAVEGAFDCLVPGGDSKIVGEHGRPGDRLERQPMCARGRQQGDDEQGMADSCEHVSRLALPIAHVQAFAVVVPKFFNEVSQKSWNF